MQVVGTCQPVRPAGVLLLSCESNLLSQVDSRKVSIGYQKPLGPAAAAADVAVPAIATVIISA